MRLHVVGLPWTQTTHEYDSCAYTAKVRKFCDMMVCDHDIFLYSGDENEAACDVHVETMTRKSQRYYGFKGPQDVVKANFDLNEKYWKQANKRVIEAMKSNIQERDILCLIGGHCQRPIAEAFPEAMAVEYGIGYEGCFANYRVYESYAWMHAQYGGEFGAAAADSNDYHTVIPNYYDASEFPMGAHDGGYFLYMGRLTDRKGWRIAQAACEVAGVDLIVAGGGEFSGYGKYVGSVGAVERAELMGGATAIFMPTRYIEPFGGVHAEAALCGTPVIGSDVGILTETVEQGANGWRCRSFRDYLEGMEWAQSLRATTHAAIRTVAQDRFGFVPVRRKYNAYFDKLQTLYGEGWYA